MKGMFLKSCAALLVVTIAQSCFALDFSTMDISTLRRKIEKIVLLEPGMNSIDLNGDGIKDLVMQANNDRGYGPTTPVLYSFYTPHRGKLWRMMEIREASNSPEGRHELITDDADGERIKSVLRIVKFKGDTAYSLIRAVKTEPGDSSPVQVEVYVWKMDPATESWFEKAWSAELENTYDSALDAVQTELKLQ